jgi:hypothetical protein
VKTENPSVCATVNCIGCRIAIALHYLQFRVCECIRCTKSNHPMQLGYTSSLPSECCKVTHFIQLTKILQDVLLQFLNIKQASPAWTDHNYGHNWHRIPPQYKPVGKHRALLRVCPVGKKTCTWLLQMKSLLKLFTCSEHTNIPTEIPPRSLKMQCYYNKYFMFRDASQAYKIRR